MQVSGNKRIKEFQIPVKEEDAGFKKPLTFESPLSKFSCQLGL